MLNVYLGEMEQAIYYPPAYFDNQYEDAWITDPLSIEMIKDVDQSEVIGPHLIESPVLGPISVKEISGTSWTLERTILQSKFSTPEIECNGFSKASKKYSFNSCWKEEYHVYRKRPTTLHLLEASLGKVAATPGCFPPGDQPDPAAAGVSGI